MVENRSEIDTGRSFATILATAGGAGYAPIAPGTFGSAVGVLLYLPLSALHPLLFALTLTAMVFLGIWASDRAEQSFGQKDDGRIVIDEVVGQLITLAPLAWLAGPQASRSLPWLGVGFLIFRCFDIWKPGPVGWAERRFEGGAGVMLDDVAAGLLAASALAALVAIFSAPGGTG